MTTLTMQDEKRIEIIQRVFRGELTVLRAAVILGISERQCYRIKRRVHQEGLKGVIHGNRGRPCKRKIKEKMIRRVVELARGKYQGFNDHHLTEKLKEHEQIDLSREKVRCILRSQGISTPRKRRASKHPSRRERRLGEGMMLQVDGSPHDWLEGRGARLCLIGALTMPRERWWELSLLRRKAPGVTCGCFQRSLNVTACRSRSIAIGTRCFGPTESPPSLSS